MIPNAIRLPGRIKEAMDMLLPGLNADEVTFEVGLPALRAGTICAPPAALERIGSSLPGRIVIHPDAWEPGTAAGIALIGHELCFHPATIIGGSFKPIAEMQVRDLVVGAFGEYGLVTDVFERDYRGVLYNIRPAYMRPLRVTPEHPILTLSMGWKAMGPSHRPGRWNQRILGPLQWKTAKEVTLDDWVVVPIPQPASSSLIEPAREAGAFPLNEDTAWLLGLIAADGWVSRGPHRDVRICLAAHEVDTAWGALKIGATLGLRRYRVGNGIQLEGSKMTVRLPGRAFNEWVDSSIGHGAYGKHVPVEVLHNPDVEVARAFLRGFWAGDGTVGGQNVSCATVNEPLVQGLQFLMARLGVLAGISVSNQPGRIINGQLAVYRNPEGIFRLTSGSPLGFQALGLDIPARKRTTQHWVRLGPSLMATKLSRIHQESYEGKVYNLSTTGGSYTAGNVAVHNCHQRQFQEIPDFMEQYDREKRYIESHGLPPWENKFERPAYEFEAQVYRRALGEGLAEGSWVPLLVEKGIASEARSGRPFPAGAVAAGVAFVGVVVIAGLRGASRG